MPVLPLSGTTALVTVLENLNNVPENIYHRHEQLKLCFRGTEHRSIERVEGVQIVIVLYLSSFWAIQMVICSL